MLFNPAADPTTVTIRIGSLNGSCCAEIRAVTVPPQAQYALPLGSLTALRGPLTLQAGAPIAAERIAGSADHLTVVGVPGTSVTAKAWNLPTVHGSESQGTVNVFNPGSTSVMVTVHADLGAGPGRWIGRAVAPFSEWRLPLSELTATGQLSSEVSANAPIVVSASWNSGALPATTLGSTAASRDWTTLVGLGGKGTSEALDLMNPSAAPATATVSIAGASGPDIAWRVTLPPHGRATWAVPGATVQNGATILISATQPIVAGQALSSHGANAAVACTPLALN